MPTGTITSGYILNNIRTTWSAYTTWDEDDFQYFRFGTIEPEIEERLAPTGIWEHFKNKY